MRARRLIEYRSTDTAGNVEAIKSQSVKIDTVNPTVSAAVSGTSIKTVTLTATDATSGVASIEYQIGDAATWTTYSTPLTFSKPGTYVVRYRAIDKAGNTNSGRAVQVVVAKKGGPVEVAKPTVTIATAPAAPNGRGGWYTSPVTVTLTGAGGEGEAEPRVPPRQRQLDGVHRAVPGVRRRLTQVQARATDATGTVSAIETMTIKMDATAPTVTVSGVADDAKLSVAAVRTARGHHWRTPPRVSPSGSSVSTARW